MNTNIYLHEIMACLVEALDAKDAYTKGHSTRVADMSCDLAIELGITGPLFDIIHLSAHLHDIGKVGVPDHILNKKGQLSHEEWLVIKKHPVIGANILCRSESLETIAKVVRHHHESFDGRGYPDGLAGEAIPYPARIIAICDSIDAMVSDRPYRKCLDWQACKAEIIKNSGRQFDPMLVNALKSLWPYWEESSETINTKHMIDCCNRFLQQV